VSGASFERLPAKPDHPALELEVLDLWERRRTFERVRERNRGGPRWSFIDGPVTANKILAVHTAWGRTLKDVFQRYRAMRGFDQRYQNGFDCQGLWIEVGVERELGFNSKREIESYGLAEFAHRCREKVVWSAEELTRGSKRLGQWMDWGADYFTFSDTNIEYIWRFTSSFRPTSTATGPTRRSSSASRSATGRASRSSCGRRRRGRYLRTSRPRSTPTPST
jgi:isoleucyl-tRNA synthetase